MALPGPQGIHGIYFSPIAPDEMWLADAPETSGTEFVGHGRAQTLPLPNPYNQTQQITADGDGGVWAIASHLYYIQGKPVPDAILYDLHGVWTIYGIAG